MKPTKMPNAEVASMIEWLTDAPDKAWEVMMPEVERSLREQFASAEYVESVRKEIMENNKTSEDLKTDLESLKVIIEEFNRGQDPNKARFLNLLYEGLANTYDIILAEGFAPRINVPIQVAVDATIPSYAKKGDAGADIYLKDTIEFPHGETILVKTGLKVALPDGWELQVRPRSGLSLTSLLRIANAPGTIDAGYRDEIGVIVTNIGTENVTLEKGTRIAQLVLAPIYKANFTVVEDVSTYGENRGGGFGSTGK